MWWPSGEKCGLVTGSKAEWSVRAFALLSAYPKCKCTTPGSIARPLYCRVFIQCVPGYHRVGFVLGVSVITAPAVFTRVVYQISPDQVLTFAPNICTHRGYERPVHICLLRFNIWIAATCQKRPPEKYEYFQVRLSKKILVSFARYTLLQSGPRQIYAKTCEFPRSRRSIIIAGLLYDHLISAYHLRPDSHFRKPSSRNAAIPDIGYI